MLFSRYYKIDYNTFYDWVGHDVLFVSYAYFCTQFRINKKTKNWQGLHCSMVPGEADYWQPLYETDPIIPYLNLFYYCENKCPKIINNVA